MKSTTIKILKYPLILLGIIIATSIIFVLSQYLKDAFFLGPEPDLTGKSILFEAEGEGVQLFWRHYQENNEYTEEYLFDEPIEGDLSDVLLRDDGLWFVVDEKINEGSSDIYIYKVFENNLEEMAFFEDGGGKYILKLNNHSEVLELVKRERDYHKDRIFNTSTMIFEQNYLNIPTDIKVVSVTFSPPCTTGFIFSGPCFFGYLKTDKLIKLKQPLIDVEEYIVDFGELESRYSISDYTVLYTIRELSVPFEMVRLGKRFIGPNDPFILSKDEEYVLFSTANISRYTTFKNYRSVVNIKEVHNYIVHIDSGKIMKISKGDVPVLMP